MEGFAHGCMGKLVCAQLHQAIRTYGPLRIVEIEHQKKWWTRRVQREARSQPKFQEECLELNLTQSVCVRRNFYCGHKDNKGFK